MILHRPDRHTLPRESLIMPPDLIPFSVGVIYGVRADC